METIIVKPEIYKEPSKRKILKSIEEGAKEAASFIKGKRKLREAKDILREL